MAFLMKTRFLLLLVIFTLIFASCSMEVTQTPPSVPSSADGVTPVPTDWKAPNLAWKDLHLTGKLIYLTSTNDGGMVTSAVAILDLLTGEVSTLFTAPDAWIYYAAVSPDARWLVLSYSPPRSDNAASSRALYALPLDGSAPPQLVFEPPTSADRYTQVEWSPDGEFLYYTHYNQEQSAGQLYESYQIYRIRYPDTTPEQIADRAFWMRPSPDSTQLVYVSLDPASGKNELFIANADGSNPQKIPLSGALLPEIIDAPLFSPDGRSVLFSAPAPAQSYQLHWLERWLGVGVASAHNIPSDWWSVPIVGGVPERLTHIQTTGLFGSLSPDQNYLASIGAEGIFVIGLDGSNLTQLISDPGVHDTVRWIP